MTPAAMSTRLVMSGEVTLAVSEWGDGNRPTVVLVHGYPDTSVVWWPVARLLADRYHVVAYDVRGAGASTAPRRTDDYRLELLARDLGAVVDATCPDAPVHLVGHDWGSIQGWEAVTTEGLAGRFASYTSVYAPGLDHAAQWARDRLRRPTPRHLRQLLDQQLRSWYIVAFHLPGAPRLGAWLAGFQKRGEKGAAPADYPAATVSADAARGVALYRANFGNRFAHPAPRPTGVPVQVIVPLHDRYVSPALSEDLQRWAPRLWRTEMAAGHWAQRSHPEVLARWIGELVDHIGGAPESRRLLRSRVGAGRTGDFEGDVVVVTGAGGGIGRAVALTFARQGAVIVAADIDGDAAARTAALVHDLGAEGHDRQVDVGDAGAMEDLAAWVGDHLGGADIVVNNAGIGMAGPALDTSVADWDRILNVNLWGVIHGSRLFGRQMVERCQGGHIVNIASMAAYAPSRSAGAYATTKAAVLMLSECLRAELAGADIGVHTICPGFVDTGIGATTRYVGVSDAEQDRLREVAAPQFRRALKPQVIADAVLEAVSAGSAVVPVGPDAKFLWSLAHLWPRAGRRLAKIDVIPT